MSDEQTKLINDLTHCLRELTIQVREDIPEEQGTDYLWTAVEDAEFLLGFCWGSSSEIFTRRISNEEV